MVLLVLALLSIRPLSADAVAVDSLLWGTDGTIVATARSGNTLYIAGAFNTVGPNTGGGVPLHPLTGDPVAGFPRVAGAVRVVISDGADGWYIGGTFVAVGGQPRKNLAHILAGGRVATWAPNPDEEVEALLLDEGVIYAGGRFHQIGGKSRDYVAAIDPGSGEVTDFNPQPDGQVRTLMSHAGRLYVGGEFASVGQQPRHGVAEFDRATGEATGWDPDANFFGNPASVHALAALGDTIFIGGSFSNMGASQRTNLASVSSTSGAPTDWNPVVTGPNDSYYGAPYVRTLLVREHTVLVGGHYTGIAGQVRNGLAEIDCLTGAATAWDPSPGPYGADVMGIALAESTVVVGGSYFSIGGQPRNLIGEVSLATALATNWNPHANDFGVFAVAASPSAIYVGGSFTSLTRQWVPRRGLAALDVTTGAVKEWNPNPNGLITYSLAIAKGHVYVGGHFSMVGGQERYGLAALDTLAGLATDWNPITDNVVTSLAVSGDTLFAGGLFATLGGVPRNRLASYDLNTGQLTTWDPSPNDDISQIVIGNNKAYVCGYFHLIENQTRNGIAAFDLTTGSLAPWNPNPDRNVNAIALTGNTVFAVGPFDHAGGQPRTGVAGIDSETGLATDFRADINSRAVYAVAALGDTVFVGGDFTVIGGVRRQALAALDVHSGAVLPWDPDLSDILWNGRVAEPVVWSLASFGSTLYAGGYFGRTGPLPKSRVAAFSFETPVPPESLPTAVAMSLIWPNPIPPGSSATVRFAIPHAGPVTLSVFNVSGRRVATILDREMRPAGTQELTLRTTNLSTGFYFCRIDADGEHATQKVVVLGGVQ